MGRVTFSASVTAALVLLVLLSVAVIAAVTATSAEGVVADVAAKSTPPVATAAAAAKGSVPYYRVVILGDVHGDLRQFQQALYLSHLIDKELKWIGNETTKFVQVGDLVDRGPDDKAVLEFAMNLSTQAAAAGSRAVFLLGNHEVMNLGGQLHYVHSQSAEFFGGKHQRNRAFKAKHPIGQFLRNMSLFHIDVKLQAIFVHAGLTAHTIKKYGGLTKLKQAFDVAVAEENWDSEIMTHPTGPLWTRKLLSDAISGNCDLLDAAMKEINEDPQVVPDPNQENQFLRVPIRRMIVGHTPQESRQIGSFCDGRIIAVDVGLSRWMYRGMSALEISLPMDTPYGSDRGLQSQEISMDLPEEEDPPTVTEPTPVVAGTTTAGTTTAGGGSASLEEALKNRPGALQTLMELLREEEVVKAEQRKAEGGKEATETAASLGASGTAQKQTKDEL